MYSTYEEGAGVLGGVGKRLIVLGSGFWVLGSDASFVLSLRSFWVLSSGLDSGILPDNSMVFHFGCLLPLVF